MKQFRNLKIMSLWLIAFGLLLSSCGSRNVQEPLVIENEKLVTIEKIVRDTIVSLPSDSIRTIVKVECPDGAKPTLKTISQGTSTRGILKLPKITQEGNYLTIDSQTTPQDVSLKIHDKRIKEQSKTTKPIYIEKPFKWYHKALMWIGAISLLLTAISLIFKLKI